MADPIMDFIPGEDLLPCLQPPLFAYVLFSYILVFSCAICSADLFYGFSFFVCLSFLFSHLLFFFVTSHFVFCIFFSSQIVSFTVKLSHFTSTSTNESTTAGLPDQCINSANSTHHSVSPTVPTAVTKNNEPQHPWE